MGNGGWGGGVSGRIPEVADEGRPSCRRLGGARTTPAHENQSHWTSPHVSPSLSATARELIGGKTMAPPRRRGLGARLLWTIVLFALGAGTGYYVRDRQQRNEVREAVQRARGEMEDAALEAIERARRAGGDLRSGAEAAAESTKAAFRELVGTADPR